MHKFQISIPLMVETGSHPGKAFSSQSKADKLYYDLVQYLEIWIYHGKLYEAVLILLKFPFPK